MQYRPNDAEFLTNGVPDEEKVLKKLENITNSIDSFLNELDLLHLNLTNIQHDIILSLSSSRNSNKSRDFNKRLTEVMQAKDRIQKLYDTNIYPLMFFIKHADHLRELKKYIDKDPYLKEKWSEVLLYMRLKDTENGL